MTQPKPDPIADEVFRHRFISVAEEMGVTLERTAYSPNIKERRDHSCALFDAEGRLVAQAAHIPVHLGAFPLLMSALVPRFSWRRGDVVLCNDPFVGGTHLPDVSLVSPVFSADEKLAGFVANRAHHADLGGAFAGSMAPTTEIYQEGVIIPPIKLHDAGHRNEDVLALILRNVRTPQERRGDFTAQLAANATGIRRLEDLLAEHGSVALQQRMDAARERSARAVCAWLHTLPEGSVTFTDYLDDDGHGSGPLPITVTLRVEGERFVADFTGTAPQQRGSINATLAVAHSAVYYAVICLLPEEVAVNHGVFSAIEVRAPEGTLVNAKPPAAVAAGNVETSQRMVDALFGALAQWLPERIPAASQGTMNNLTLGGISPETGAPWAYYETLGGGAGACSKAAGASGIHCHMSNTRNTPAEALEYHYPLRVRRYALRDGSGGAGLHSGGEGVIREIELLASARATLLTDRRDLAPWGSHGGGTGAPGINTFWNGAEWETLPAKGSFELGQGTRLRIETPGGGGYGSPTRRPSGAHREPAGKRHDEDCA